MARNLSKDLKRLVAGLCAVLIVGGAVPLQPLVNFGGTFKAAADSVGNVSYQAVEYTCNSTGINYGLILKVGNTLNTSGTSGNFKFMTKTKVQYANIDSVSYIGGDSGSSIMSGVSKITPNSDGTFTATFSSGTTATLYPEKGCTFNIKYTSSAWEISQIKISDIEYNKVYTNVTDFNNAPCGTYPVLKLSSNQDSLNVSRDDGILDLNGKTVTTLYLTNKVGTLIVRDGTVVTIDDQGEINTSFNGNVILSNVIVTNRVYAGARTFYYIGTTSVSGFNYESGDLSPLGSYGSNYIARPIAQTGLVYNGENQLLIDTSAMKGIYGCTLSGGYFTYWYNRTGQNDNYVKGTTANGVVDPNCTPIYAKDAGTYTVYFMWDMNSDFIAVNYGSFTVTIAKADPEYTVPENLDVKTGSKLSDIQLPEGWSWNDPNTSVGEPGTKTFTATFTPNDTTNYNIIENIDVPVTVKDYVDLEFTDMADGVDYAVDGDENFAYIIDGATIYSNQTIVGDISKVQLKENTQTNGYTYNEKTYKYKYDVTFSQELDSGSKVTLKHVHEYGNPHVETTQRPDVIIADCTGEKGESVGTIEIAQLQPKEVYHYGDLPTVNDVVIVPEQIPNGITSITPKSLSIRNTEKTTTQETFTTFGTYELSAVVDVVYNGRTVPCTITKNVQYAPRSLFGEPDSSSADEEYTGCYFYLRRYEETEEPQEENPALVEHQEEEPAAEQGSTPEIQEENPPAEEQGEPAEQQELQYEDTLLTVKNGVITLPKNSFVYNKREQKPVIVVKNKINGQVFELTEDEISSTVEGKTGANKDNEFYEFKISAVQPESEEAAPANYTGEVTVKWRIEKAPNNVTFVPKTDTVYDAEVLDDTDFTFTDPDDTLNDSNIKVDVKGKTTGTVTATSGDHYMLSSADNYNTLSHVADAAYVLPDNYTYTFIGKYMSGGSVKTVTANVEQTWFGEIVSNNSGNYWRLFDKTGSDSRTIGFATITVVFNDTAHTADIICFENNDLYNRYMAKLGESSDITSAGIQKGTITITSDNYQDKVMDFETTIAKKEVTVAPNGIKDNEKNTITWGELIKDSDVLYTQDGVVDKDKPAGGDYNFGLIFTAEGYNFEDASKNNVGEYKLVPSDIFVEYNAADNNYLLVLPKEESEEQEELAEPIYMLSTEQGEPGESEEITEDEPEGETEDVKLDTLTIVPYELTKANVSISDINYQFDTYTKNPTVTVTVPYSVKGSDKSEDFTLVLGTVEDHADKDFFVKGVRYDNIVGEKNIAVMTDETTNKNFTACENGLEFKWYINNGTLSIEVSDINNKIYDGAAVAEPTVTVTNQINEVVNNASTKIQYQKKDEESGEYGEAFDGEPKDAGTYRAVVTANADSYDEAVTNSNDFVISKREVKVDLFGLPEVKGYNDKTVSYQISVADPDDPDNNTGIVNNEINPEGNVDIESGKQDGDHITNADLPKIVEILGDNYTFTYDVPLTLRDARLKQLVVYKAYMEDGETIDPNDYFAAYDENGKDITDKCKVINIDNIDQFGEYTIEVNDGSIVDPLTDVLYVKPKSDEIEERFAELPDPEDVTVLDERLINDAREAYEALSDKQKENISDEELQKLVDAENALEAAKKAAADKEAADAVKKAINDLPAAEDVTVDDAEAIEDAREAFEALTDDQKALVDGDTMNKLDDAEAALEAAKKEAADQAAADAVKKAINDLPTAENVTVDDADAITAACEAFEALTGDQKNLVDGDTMKKLDDAVAALDTAKKTAEKAAEDQAAADAVKKAINDLPAAENVTVDDADAIAEVREAFEALTDDQKGMVDGDTMKKLDDAEAALDTAKKAAEKAAEDQAAADAVKNAINALPAAEDLTKDDAEAIANARKLFDELTDEQKALIDPEVIKKLTDGEAAVAAISEFIKGDVNGDGKININDLTKIAAHVKGKKLLTEEEQMRADVNGDGKLDINDISKIAAHIKGKRLLK